MKASQAVFAFFFVLIPMVVVGLILDKPSIISIGLGIFMLVFVFFEQKILQTILSAIGAGFVGYGFIRLIGGG